MKEFRLYDFNEINEIIENDGSDDDNENKYVDKKEFIVQMFGINSQGKTCSIRVESYEPFFYVKVPNEWTNKHVGILRKYLKKDSKL